MHRLSLFLLAAILFSCSSSKNSATTKSPNTLSGKEKNDGWQLLFDGKTTDGWHTYGKQNVTDRWKVQDGAIYLNVDAKNSDRGDLVSNEEFGNFDLQLDWKISEKGNSGIIFYIQDDKSKYPNTYNTGMEMQVLDNGTPTRLGHSDAKIYTHRAGDLYDLLSSADGTTNPLGEWNHVEIKSVNGKLDFYMNGKHSLSINLWDENWNKMISISKFKDMPGFGTFKQGKISLQDHGNQVWYRNIKIKRL
jgi:hypothetical protein